MMGERGRERECVCERERESVCVFEREGESLNFVVGVFCLIASHFHLNMVSSNCLENFYLVFILEENSH